MRWTGRTERMSSTVVTLTFSKISEVSVALVIAVQLTPVKSELKRCASKSECANILFFVFYFLYPRPPLCLCVCVCVFVYVCVCVVVVVVVVGRSVGFIVVLHLHVTFTYTVLTNYQL